MDAVTRLDLHIDPQSPIPLYYQIRENLRELILSEKLAPGDAIPSERELSQVYKVNRLTVRQAITELVNEGLLYRQQGVGTFVAQPKITQAMPTLMGFTDRMLQAGQRPSSRVLLLEEIPAPDSVLRPLGLSPGAMVIRLVRLRLVNGEPFMLETTFLSQTMFPNLAAHDLENQSLYHLFLEVYGVPAIEADEIIEPVALTQYEAELLETEVHKPALLVEGTVYTHGRRPVEFTRSLVRGDKARYHFRIHRYGDNTTTG